MGGFIKKIKEAVARANTRAIEQMILANWDNIVITREAPTEDYQITHIVYRIDVITKNGKPAGEIHWNPDFALEDKGQKADGVVTDKALREQILNGYLNEAAQMIGQVGENASFKREQEGDKKELMVSSVAVNTERHTQIKAMEGNLELLSNHFDQLQLRCVNGMTRTFRLEPIGAEQDAGEMLLEISGVQGMGKMYARGIVTGEIDRQVLRLEILELLRETQARMKNEMSAPRPRQGRGR